MNFKTVANRLRKVPKEFMEDGKHPTALNWSITGFIGFASVVVSLPWWQDDDRYLLTVAFPVFAIAALVSFGLTLLVLKSRFKNGAPGVKKNVLWVMFFLAVAIVCGTLNMIFEEGIYLPAFVTVFGVLAAAQIADDASAANDPSTNSQENQA